MGQLAGLILRYGVVLGKAMWEASKKGIDLFKPKKMSKPEPKMSDADYQKKFKAQKDKALKDKKIADRTDKIVEKKEKKLLKQEKEADKPAVKSAKKFRKDTKGQREGKKFNPDPRTDSMNYSEKEAREYFLNSRTAKKDALREGLSNYPELMNTPVAAMAVAGTTASLISKRKKKSHMYPPPKKKGT